MKKLKKLIVLVHATPARSTGLAHEVAEAFREVGARARLAALHLGLARPSTPRRAIAETTNESASASDRDRRGEHLHEDARGR